MSKDVRDLGIIQYIGHIFSSVKSLFPKVSIIDLGLAIMYVIIALLGIYVGITILIGLAA